MPHGLIFGIYPGSAVGGDPSSGVISGPADDPASIKAALDYLQVRNRPFVVRGYMHYIGSGKTVNITPVDMMQYVTGQRKLDLVLCYRTQEENIADWTRFIRMILHTYSDALTKIQITEEPTNPDAATGGDGNFPNIKEAIVAGVLAAKAEVQNQGLQIQVGFNATPSLDAAHEFWVTLAQQSNYALFLEALDYVGLDFFPDVFRPLPSGLSLQAAVAAVLTNFRTVSLAAARIPATVPIHITEHGWPTGLNRSGEQQARTIEAVIRTIHQHRTELNITHYEFFDLRDSDSMNSNFQFGLLRDDYAPKPAFEVFRKLIAELG